MSTLEELIWLVPLLPLLSTLWIGAGFLAGWNRGEAGENESSKVAIITSLLSLLLIVAIDIKALIYGIDETIIVGNWFNSGMFSINLSFTLDTLGLLMTTLVATITLLTIRFSVNYLHREAGYQRFFMLLSMFSFAMLLIVSAGNIGILFVGWEVAGVSSYLLIAYNYNRNNATKNATQAIVTNRVGDASLLAAIFFSTLWLGTLEWSEMAASELLVSESGGMQLGLISFTLILAAFVKSAQIPFSPWITRALEGPTPSSSIFYGSLMIHAGVYLVLRLEPFIENSVTASWALLTIGGITAIYGYLSALVQTDIKSTLIFSTISQVGVMFVGCGLGWFEAVTIYLILHAIWRSWQFLNAPAHMHSMSQPTAPAPIWLQRMQRLYAAAMQRFWLDQLTQWLLLRPTQRLSKDIHAFDSNVVRPIIGSSNEINVVSSLAEWEEKSAICDLESTSNSVPLGSGMFGSILQQIATLFKWIEEHLILKGGGDGMVSAIKGMESFINKVEQQLSMPRYLLLMIMATFVVIL
ncbi:MAG: hypothetical protein HOM84_01325 [Thiotrichales bacterium]|jgi:NADH:ubiquinone oxidoreductase subunit 5 (subunit L)/multisubunit Na+/H+ antiporter MnhA subunit|nr:hypothetical protein [Thiotrichales bacterium]MBT3612742.1 hypothetical protein [Thiotrichales bacterium]MBT3752893.1 hypothetical protein [Thiotrichales bacterium]MBT3837635.1 hypothetical protein [Thiotrichales bacterium]MBT4152752.1 hypothetical protein [Thiotrichales bacterium]